MLRKVSQHYLLRGQGCGLTKLVQEKERLGNQAAGPPLLIYAKFFVNYRRGHRNVWYHQTNNCNDDDDGDGVWLGSKGPDYSMAHSTGAMKQPGFSESSLAIFCKRTQFTPSYDSGNFCPFCFQPQQQEVKGIHTLAGSQRFPEKETF